jgi:hypothetical protein
MVSKSYWRDANDLSYTVQTTWDNGNLYVLINVVDDKLIILPEKDKGYGSASLYDSVEIFFDDRGEGSNMDKITAGAIQFLVIPSLTETPSSCRITNNQVELYNIRFIGQKTEKGYIMEGRITPTPYAVEKNKLGITQGRVIGFDVAIDDCDDKPGERKTQMVLYGTENNYKEATRWGRFKLE